MNKKLLTRVVNLFHDGVSEQLCIAVLIELLPSNSTSLQKGVAIHTFYETVFDLEITQAHTAIKK